MARGRFAQGKKVPKGREGFSHTKPPHGRNKRSTQKQASRAVSSRGNVRKAA